MTAGTGYLALQRSGSRLAPWIILEGRAATDTYSQFQEERVAVYSNQTSQYRKFLRDFTETNIDFMARINHNFGEFSLNGLIGSNIRRTTSKLTDVSTLGGLIVPELYNLYNSRSPVQTTEYQLLSGVNSLFSKVSVSIVGRNLWIIHKNMPYYDPEASLSAGNIQGIADGTYPSTRTLGLNLSVDF